MKKSFVGAAILSVLLLAASAFGQATSTVSGSITDATQAVLPGATVTATNTETGIAKTAVSNAAGVYNFAGVQSGKYKISAELAGFQTQTFTDVEITPPTQIRLNFTLQVRKLEQSVEVSVRSENLLLESSSSAGVVLPEKKIVELPLVNSNVLSLIKVMGGVTMSENPIFGADDTQFAGVSASNINLQRDGITVNDVRWATGLNSPVYLNPEMVGEFKMVLSPVDAEMGRGNGQVQVISRSGANAFHGSAVWNLQNTYLDANEWLDNKRQLPRDWRNQNEMTLSLGGPIIKNKTFFFVSWDQQWSRVRQNNVNMQVPTKCARKGIWRYFDNWSGGNALTVTSQGTGTYNPGVTATVNADGSPKTNLNQPNSTTPAALHLVSVFGPMLRTPSDTTNCSDVTVNPSTGFADSTWVNYGSLWDPLRPPDSSGYTPLFMSKYVPLPNNYQIGDGLNWGGFRYVRHLNGGDNIYGLGEGPNRKQINARIDHNFNPSNRINGTYTYERDIGEDAFPTLPNKAIMEDGVSKTYTSYGGSVTRYPQSFSINYTATIKPTLLNEARVGLSRTKSWTNNPLDNPINKGKLKTALNELYPLGGDLPLIVGIGSPGFEIGNGSNTPGPWGTGRGNFSTTWGGVDPRWTFGDTITWTKGRHSFKFGWEMQRTGSDQDIDGDISFTTGNTYFPQARGASYMYGGYSPNAGFHTPFFTADTTRFPGMAGGLFWGNVVSGAYNLVNIYSGTVQQVGQWRFINKPTQTAYNDITKGEKTRYSKYRQNQWDFFVKDDWKLSDSFTLNLGLRYEKYNVGYLKDGMTSGLKGGALSVFARSGHGFADWMKPGTMNSDGSVTYQGSDAELAFIGPDSPNSGQQLFHDDNNNFGPAIGFAWQLPWFGKGKTTLRGGYQLTYMPPGRAGGAAFAMPRISYSVNFAPNSQTPFLSLANLRTLTYNGQNILPIVPLDTFITPPAANPVFPVQQRSQTVSVYDPNMQAPYIQNLTLSLTRNIGSNVTLDVRYIGTLTRKQEGSINLNSANIWNNGLKEAFDLARAGQESTLLDRMFAGINIAGGGYGPVGTVYNGVLQTGAMHLRAFGTTNANLANGNYIALAGSLATLNYVKSNYGNSTLPDIPNDTRGVVLRYNHFPENFIYTSPQFATATWTGNLNHSNYHSLQTQLTVRPTHGFNVSGTYTWSKNLSMGAYTDPRNFALDYGLNTMNRAHQIAINGAFELPFGPGHWLLNGNNGFVSRLVGGWQASWIFNFATGRPFGITAGNTPLYGNSVPNLISDFDKKSGHVVWLNGASNANYFYDASIGQSKYTLKGDILQCNNVTALQNLRNNCTIQAIVTTASTLAANNPTNDPTKYKYVFVNPYPGERGNFRYDSLTQEAVWSADMAMSKAIRITEGKTLQFRMDATNVFNHQTPTMSTYRSGVVRIMVPSAPVATMGYTYSFTDGSYAYRNLGYMDAKINARTFQAKVRFDF